jgi:plasmid stability protein
MENKTALNIRNFPKDLKKDLKIVCSMEGISIQDKVIDIIRMEVEKAKLAEWFKEG